MTTQPFPKQPSSDSPFPAGSELDTVFVQIAPGRLVVGSGPFESSEVRNPEQPAFYINDFFLTSAAPWKRPHRWVEADAASYAPVGENKSPRISWDELPEEEFRSLFESARSAIEEGLFSKIVPIMFQSGGADLSPDSLSTYLLSRIAGLPSSLHAYGAIGGRRGLIGASPEILFQKEGDSFRTMALAGTRALERADELLSDVKERAEHQIVVDDIVEQLSGTGVTAVGPTEVRTYPNLAHLATAIDHKASSPLSFDDAVRRLHPTAALGYWPRSERARSWLLDADREQKRGMFGAPFGVEMPDGRAVCLVAIRNVEWSGSRVRIGAGGGILRGSVMQREREEQKRKRDQVKEVFGLRS